MRLKVTCKKCGESDVVTMDTRLNRPEAYDKMMNTNITSFRYRADEKYGWECICGNYDLLAKQEYGNFTNLVSGSPMRLSEIAQMLKEPKVKFAMEKI